MPVYRYKWKNNSKRMTLYGREFKVLVRGRKNSAKVEFTDNGQREVWYKRLWSKINGWNVF